MKAVLLDGKADLIVSTTPFVFDPELQAKSRVLFTQRDAMGTSELSFWTAREGFIGKNRAAMVDLLEDSLRAVRWYLPPTGPRRSTSLPASSSSLRPGSRAGSSPGTTSTGTPTGW
jgi:NitT/TauT family transport system substrate-binding protein